MTVAQHCEHTKCQSTVHSRPAHGESSVNFTSIYKKGEGTEGKLCVPSRVCQVNDAFVFVAEVGPLVKKLWIWSHFAYRVLSIWVGVHCEDVK